MPPSPTIKAVVDEAKYTTLCSTLRIPKPKLRVIIAASGAQRVRGEFDPARWQINLYVGLDAHSIESLRHVQGQIVSTLLHEIRHAWQRTHWTTEKQVKGAQGHYAVRDEEADANQYMQQNAAAHRNLVHVRRVQHGSGFSKLSRHASPRMV